MPRCLSGAHRRRRDRRRSPISTAKSCRRAARSSTCCRAGSAICRRRVDYRRVVGIGADACALSENPFLDEWRVQDLNANPKLPFADGEFDGATICVAIQHLTRPGELIREVARVLRPGAPLVVTFSQRCLATRAIACWCLLDDAAQLCLVAQHFAETATGPTYAASTAPQPAAAARSTPSSAGRWRAIRRATGTEYRAPRALTRLRAAPGFHLSRNAGEGKTYARGCSCPLARNAGEGARRAGEGRA